MESIVTMTLKLADLCSGRKKCYECPLGTDGGCSLRKMNLLDVSRGITEKTIVMESIANVTLKLADLCEKKSDCLTCPLGKEDGCLLRKMSLFDVSKALIEKEELWIDCDSDDPAVVLKDKLVDFAKKPLDTSTLRIEFYLKDGTKFQTSIPTNRCTLDKVMQALRELPNDFVKVTLYDGSSLDVLIDGGEIINE